MQKSDLVIPVPCTVDWKKMTPADKGRFCGDCKKVVRDLSKMSELDARALVASSKGADLCVRYLYDRHGKIFFAGDHRASGLLPQSLLNRAKRTAMAAATLAVPMFLQACSASPLDALEHKSSHSPNSPTSEDDPNLTENMGGAPYEPQHMIDASPDAKPIVDQDAAVDAGPPIEETDAAADGGLT